MNQLEQIKTKISFACEKCGASDYRLEIETRTITTFNAPASASGGTSEPYHLDTTRASQAHVTVICNKCGQRWNPA